MPSRVIRDGWIESEAVNSLDTHAERFFLRLCLRADDFGRYHANPVLLKSALFPLKEDMRSTDMPRLTAACEKAGLIRCYEVAGKGYLEILKFDQRMRAKRSKFPSHDGHMPDACLAHDGHMTGRRRPESESESESESNSHTEGGKSVNGSVDWIERIRQAYPRQDSHEECRNAIASAISAGAQSPDAILAQVTECAAWVRKIEADAPNGFVSSARNFFSRRKWTEPAEFQALFLKHKEAKEKRKPGDPQPVDRSCV